MFKGMKYVLSENLTNLFRIYSICKYEVLSDIRDTQLGIFWDFATPAIRVLTFWFAFGVVFNRKEVTSFDTTVPFLPWQIAGMCVWMFVAPCITSGCRSIHAKINVITRMKFPVSILPATVIGKELFHHFCILVIMVFVYAGFGYYPELEWLGILYYAVCAICFTWSLALCTSVLTMLYRDVAKLISSCMRMLLYLTPIFWEMDRLVKSAPTFVIEIMRRNPIYYIVLGYRDSFFFHQGMMHYKTEMINFWIVCLVLFVAGSSLMYKYKNRFSDLY